MRNTKRYRFEWISEPDGELEKFLTNGKPSLVCGVDEAGRGALAGPVVAASVVFKMDHKNTPLNGVADSKKLTPSQREKFFEEIIEKAESVGFGVVGSEKIDEINIYRASQKAMTLAVINLKVKPDIIITDAVPIEVDGIPVVPAVFGDRISFVVAAASILAKVVRDRIMINYDRLFPQYGFAKHKGYPTKFHKKVIREIGPCKIHRLSFNLGV